jgi:hypothetical protein
MPDPKKEARRIPYIGAISILLALVVLYACSQ